MNGNPWLDWSVIVGAVALALVGAAIYARVRGRIENVETSAVMLDLEDEDPAAAETETGSEARNR